MATRGLGKKTKCSVAGSQLQGAKSKAAKSKAAKKLTSKACKK